MKAKKKRKFSDTKFQRFLAHKGACYDGRRKVGSQAIQEWWQSTRRADWMVWLLKALYPDDSYALYSRLGITSSYGVSTKLIRDFVLHERIYIQLP